MESDGGCVGTRPRFKCRLVHQQRVAYSVDTATVVAIAYAVDITVVVAVNQQSTVVVSINQRLYSLRDGESPADLFGSRNCFYGYGRVRLAAHPAVVRALSRTTGAHLVAGIT